MRIAGLFILIVFLLSGCIEIVETIHVNEDTSGSAEYRVMSVGSNSWIGNISGYFNNSVEQQLRSEAKKLVILLEKQEGISNVKYEFGNFSADFYVRFDFAGSKYYNDALYQLGGYRKTCLSPGYLKINKHKVKKRNITPWLNRYLEKEGIEMKQSFISDVISFRSIIELPSKLRRVKPENLTVSDNKTSVQQRVTFTDMLDKHKSTGMKLIY